MEKTYLSKEEWVSLFKEVGVTEQMMDDWHARFEKRSPAAHQSFLQWLHISTDEIEEIRSRYGKN